ncbi:MAG: Holliday junction resolvase RuvX [Bacteroidales bacterium]|nr:Holliday junction resolvase RuvX [Bacteroidales bacterium]
MGRIIALDYGNKRTGIAVTDELQMIAQPLITVPTHELLDFIIGYIRKEPVDCIVVGEPRTMNNMESNTVKYIEPFIRKLTKVLPGIKVLRMDERFTSRMALRAILESGKGKKARQDKSLVDKVSAALILQSFLDQKSNFISKK